MSELPEGITISTFIDQEAELVPFDFQDELSCELCGLKFEAFLLTPNNRYEGLIRNAVNGIELWNNKLPRDRNKALKLLQENFTRKVENHRKAH